MYKWLWFMDKTFVNYFVQLSVSTSTATLT